MVYQTLFAYTISFAVYQFGMAVTGQASLWIVPAVIMDAFLANLFLRNPKHEGDEISAEAV